MPDFSFIAMRSKTRHALPGPPPTLSDWETRWRDAYSNSEPRVLMSNGEWRVSPGDVRPIVIHPRYFKIMPPVS
jgi:hypothetical protein